ncbi:MAG: type I pullulanase [Acholeplasmataceae bacterium]
MKKILFSMMLGFTLIGLNITSEASELPTSLVIHYYRYDGDYTDFNFWMWESEPESLGGIQHDFDVENVDEYGVYHVVDLEEYYPDATEVGIIIKQGSGWEGYREVGGDRFIDLTEVEVKGGVAHAYFVEQDPDIGLSDSDLEANIPDYRDRILTAVFATDMDVEATLTAIPELGYEIHEDGESILSVPESSSRTIDVSLEDVDIAKNYTLVVHFNADRTDEKTISLQNLYDTNEFEELYTYDGTLGVSFEDEFTVFRLWAPLSESVSLNLYHQGHPDYDDEGNEASEETPYETHMLYPIENGAWEVRLTGDYLSDYYTFTVTNNGVAEEVTDPYAYSTGANGQRAMIVDFEETDPEGWTENDRPDTIRSLTDYIVYELHVRDLTSHESWQGTENYRGKFMGLTEKGTTYRSDDATVTTGLDHIAELGVNAVQLLPIFDFGYVDEIEAFQDPNYANIFNWGYMPYHFNTLEGSYATNPFDGEVRIEEFKQAVKALHDYDIRVIMDVVYNHTGESETSNFHKIVPGYYHRLTETGGFSNGSGTGNETASERSMMRKFMLDSVEFLATEYNLSGFRFDLMALHDVETMSQIQSLLESIDPTIVVYGEPWMGGESPLDEGLRADKENLSDMTDVGAFNDVTRDALKGSVFEYGDPGWIQGEATFDTNNGIRYGIVGGIEHPDYSGVDPWHLDPNRMVNYASAHDNHTLYDKFMLTGLSGSRNRNRVKAMQIQSNAVVLASQGISFLHAGVEFMRSKPLEEGGYDHNSYESPDSVNQLRWDRKARYVDVFEYYKDLIQIRRSFDHFRMDDADSIRSRLSFLATDQNDQAIAYRIAGEDNGPELVVVHSGNPSGGLTHVELPAGKDYDMLTYAEASDPNGLEVISGDLYVPSNTSVILVERTEERITIADDVVEIDPGDAFDPEENVTVNRDDYPDLEVHYSSGHDVDRPGEHTITVAVTEPFGRTTHYYYVLRVRGGEYDVNLIYPN